MPAVRAGRSALRRHAGDLGLIAGVLIAAVLRLGNALGAPDVIWFDSKQYIKVAHHALFSAAFWTGSQPPLVPLLWKLTGSPTSFAALQSSVAVAAWSLLAWTVWRWLGSGVRGVAAAWVVLAFSLTPFVLQWDASVLSESVSLAAVAVLFAAGLLLLERFTWIRAAALLGAGVAFELARDSGIVVIGVLGVGLALWGAIEAVRHHALAAWRSIVLAALMVLGAGMVGLAAVSAHRTVVNVENALDVRVFPNQDMVTQFVALGMPQGREITAVARTLRASRPTPYAYASPKPSHTTTLVVGPILTEPYWTPLRRWITAHGEGAYLSYLLSHPAYVASAPFHRPSLAFNSPSSLTYYQAQGHGSLSELTVLFPPRLLVVAEAVLAAGLLLVRGTWRRRDVAFLAAMVPLGLLAMAVGWFGDGQEVARHVIEGNVTVRLAVLLLFLWALLARSPRPHAKPDGVKARTGIRDPQHTAV